MKKKGQGRKDNNETEHPILGGKEREQGKARSKNTLGPCSGVTEWWGKILEVFSHPDQASQIGKAGRELAMNVYNCNVQAKRLVSFFSA